MPVLPFTEQDLRETIGRRFEEQAEELYQGDSSKRKKKSAQVQV